MVEERQQIEIYTDGGCDPNPGPGGWGAIILLRCPEAQLPRMDDAHKVMVEDGTATVIRELSGSDPDTTNNRMELTAAIEVLRALKQPCDIDFFTDSQYLRQGITEWLDGWAARGWIKRDKKPVLNADLWQTLSQLRTQHDIQWHWVKGHAGNVYNERADQLASDAIPRPETTTDPDATRVYLRVTGDGTTGAFGWAACIARGDDMDYLDGGEAKATVNGFTLSAAIAILAHISPGEPAQFFTNNPYLYDGITKWVQGWRRGGWRKPGKFRDEWQLLYRLNEERSIIWARFRNNDAPEEFDMLKERATAARDAVSE